jgi:hypothetical protein
VAGTAGKRSAAWWRWLTIQRACFTDLKR